MSDLSLADCTVAYCDSDAVLRAARAAGLPAGCEIRTSSPHLSWTGDPAVVNYERLAAAPIYQAVIDGSEAAIEAVMRAADTVYGTSALSRSLGRVAFMTQVILLKAATLTDRDYDRPVAVLEGDCGDPAVEPFVRSPWADLLAANPERIVFRATVPLPRDRATLGGDPPTAWQRLARPNWMKWAFQVSRKILERAPLRYGRGLIYVASENEYAKETAGRMALSGWNVRVLNPSAGAADTAGPGEKDLAAVIEAFRPFVARFTVPKASDAVLEIFRRRAVDDIALYRATRRAADAAAAASDRKRQMIFLGGGGGGRAAALSDAFRERGYPAILFQHGLDREISERLQKQRVCYDTAFADTFIAYNKRSVEGSTRNPFSLPGAVCAEGAAPREYFGSTARKADGAILYVSTLLYRAYVQPRFDASSDADQAAQEIRLIDDVFGALPHAVSFKPYPAVRYLDPDPVIEALHRHDNIRIVGARFDGRYIYDRYRVLVSTRATSTFGWLLATGRPLVYIDFPGGLRDCARDLVREGTLYIDGSAPDWPDALHALLSRPIAEIEALFAEKHAGYNRLRRELLPGDGRDGARKAAAFLNGLQERA